jgi:hypothetical protein
MLGRNIDFFAVSVIALAMLAFAEVRSWHVTEALDSIHISDAIHIQRCPISGQVWSNLSAILH